MSLLLAMMLSMATDQPRMVVLDLQRVGGTTEAEATLITDAVADRLTRIGLYQVITQREVATLLGVERQKQLLGCGEDATSCIAELSGALDARFVLSGQLNRLGGMYQLSLQVLDSKKSQTAGRAMRAAKTLDDLRALLPWAVADATGTAQPKPPSRTGPTLLMVGGGLTFAAGGVVAFRAFTDEAAIARELQNGADDPGVLRSAREYQEQARDIAGAKTVSFLLLAIGAGLAAGGVSWWMSQPAISSGRIALVPTGNGVALVGELP